MAPEGIRSHHVGMGEPPNSLEFDVLDILILRFKENDQIVPL